MEEKRLIEELLERSRRAQKEAWNYSQERVDELAAAILYSLSRQSIAEEIARLSYEESQLGTYEAKVSRMTGKLPQIWQQIQNYKTVGVIEELPEQGIIKIGKPVGTIAALIPSTVPDGAPVFKGVLSLRGRNSIIFAPHPRTKKTTNYVVEKMREVLRINGAPEDLFLCIEEPSKSLSQMLMAACDLTFATGSHDMVVAAYSSGKPAFGVGAGNAVVVVDETADLKSAAAKIRSSKIVDNATGCSAENSLVIQEGVYDEFLGYLKEEGAYICSGEEKEVLQKAMWKNGMLNRDIVARPVQTIAEVAGLTIPEDRTFIVVEETGYGKEFPFSGEKLSLVLTVYRYKEFEDAISLVNGIHAYSGSGHSCGIHSYNEDHIMALAMNTKTTKVLVDQPHRGGNSGAWYNGLARTFSLGCGTWGGNIVSENITQKHFINITWLSRPTAAIGVVPFNEKQIFRDYLKNVKTLQS